MNGISNGLKKFSSQVLYFLMAPVFFFFFTIVYKPYDLTQSLDMGRGLFSFNVAIMTSIILVILVISRLLFFIFREKMKLNYFWYTFWCIGEIIVVSFFVALYLWLMLGGDSLYLDVMKEYVQDIFLTLIYPYLIITLSVIVKDRGEELTALQFQTQEQSADTNLYTRFYDANNNQKLSLITTSILYIAAQENYLRIYYVDNDKVTNYLLRNQMKNIEEYCQSQGLVRCHRSYFINSTRIQLLKKEKEGVIYAELNAPEPIKIPVTRKYYDSLAQML